MFFEAHRRAPWFVQYSIAVKHQRAQINYHHQTRLKAGGVTNQLIHDDLEPVKYHQEYLVILSHGYWHLWRGDEGHDYLKYTHNHRALARP